MLRSDKYLKILWKLLHIVWIPYIFIFNIILSILTIHYFYCPYFISPSNFVRLVFENNQLIHCKINKQYMETSVRSIENKLKIKSNPFFQPIDTIKLTQFIQNIFIHGWLLTIQHHILTWCIISLIFWVLIS